MSNRDIIENYQRMLQNLEKGIKSDPFLGNYIDIVKNLSHKKRFNLAKEFLYEVEASGLLAGTGFGSSRSEVAEVYRLLLSSFQEHKEIHREEFIELITNPKLCTVITYLVKNKALPIDLLLDKSMLSIHESKVFYWILRKQFIDAKLIRYPEIVSYLRNVVPESKHMSDEMVMKVAGFTFER